MEGLTPTKLTDKGRPPKENNWELTADQVSTAARRKAEREAEAKVARLGRDYKRSKRVKKTRTNPVVSHPGPIRTQQTEAVSCSSSLKHKNCDE